MKYLLILILSISVLVGAYADGEGTLGERLAKLENANAGGWRIIPYKPNYILPVAYNSDPSTKAIHGYDEERGREPTELDEVEVKFQISFMFPIAKELFAGNGNLYGAYTQVSHWQAFNSDISEGFRDTNYEPELFMLFDTDFDVLGLTNKGIRLGFVHQSNGRGIDALSRSWNRAYVAFMLERENLTVGVRPWYRFSEDADEDENPDIEDYLGYGDLNIVYTLGDHTLSAILRNNFDTSENRGAVQLGWSFPLSEYLRGYVQYFNGYGESLMTHDEHDQRIGFGVMLSDWL